jgi:hypothetical protein
MQGSEFKKKTCKTTVTIINPASHILICGVWAGEGRRNGTILN